MASLLFAEEQQRWDESNVDAPDAAGLAEFFSGACESRHVCLYRDHDEIEWVRRGRFFTFQTRNLARFTVPGERRACNDPQLIVQANDSGHTEEMTWRNVGCFDADGPQLNRVLDLAD